MAVSAPSAGVRRMWRVMRRKRALDGGGIGPAGVHRVHHHGGLPELLGPHLGQHHLSPLGLRIGDHAVVVAPVPVRILEIQAPGIHAARRDPDHPALGRLLEAPSAPSVHLPRAPPGCRRWVDSPPPPGSRIDRPAPRPAESRTRLRAARGPPGSRPGAIQRGTPEARPTAGAETGPRRDRAGVRLPYRPAAPGPRAAGRRACSPPGRRRQSRPLRFPR
jgi:hypothetical protein